MIDRSLNNQKIDIIKNVVESDMFPSFTVSQNLLQSRLFIGEDVGKISSYLLLVI